MGIDRYYLVGFGFGMTGNATGDAEWLPVTPMAIFRPTMKQIPPNIFFPCRWAPPGIMRGPALSMFRYRACLYLAGCFSPAFYFEGRLREMPCRLSEAGHCYAILHTRCYIGSAFVLLS